MKKTILVFGLISGAISVIMFVYFALTQKENDFGWSEIAGYTTIVLSMSLVFFGVKSYRDRYQNGVITFGKAFQVGILITLISCLIYVIGWIIVYYTLIPDFMERYSSHMIEKAKASGASQAKIEKTISQMEGYKAMYSNPFTIAALTFLEPFPIGLLVTLITALILRRKPKTEEAIPV